MKLKIQVLLLSLFFLKNYSSPDLLLLLNNKFNNKHIMHKAIKENNIEKVKILLKNGTDANETDINGQTPLMLAIELFDFEFNNLEIIKLLVQYKSDINIKDNQNESVLDKISKKTLYLEEKRREAYSSTISQFQGFPFVNIASWMISRNIINNIEILNEIKSNLESNS